MNTIIFFSRTPESGHGKTRLRKDVPDEKVDAIAAYLYEKMYGTLANTPFRLVIHYDGKVPAKDVPSSLQEGRDLGDKMARSLQRELPHGPALLIGSDLMGVDEDYIADAFRALEKKDIVLGPARDGGYGLVGITHFVDIFSGITYSQGDVLENTVKKAKAQGKSVALLDTIRDIDDISDLAAEVLESPIASFSENETCFLFCSDDGKELKVFKRDPNNTSGLLHPTIMMPFFHFISNNVKETL